MNSAGPGSANCGTLFTKTGTSTDTAAAAIAMAHVPFTNVGALFGLASSSTPFQPGLGTAPVDLTVSLLYQTPLYEQNLLAPDATYITFLSTAIDSGGNIWIYGSNEDAPAPSDTVQTFVKYSALGSTLATTAVPSASSGFESVAPFVEISVDSSDNVWAGTLDGIDKLSSQGTLISPANGYACSGLSQPISIVFGTSNRVFAGQIQSTTIPVLSLNGTCLGPLTDASADFFGPVAVTRTGDILGTDGANVYVFAEGGATETSFPAHAEWMATDAAGDVWTHFYTSAAQAGGAVGEILAKYSGGGMLISPIDGYTGGGLSPYIPGGGFNLINFQGLEIDGAGAVWLASEAGVIPGGNVSPIVGLHSDGTPITPSSGLISSFNGGYVYSVAPDGSGNLWANPSDGSLVEYVGLTTPVATPTLYTQLGQRP